MSDKFTCKNCPDRALLCHSTCEKYLTFRKKMDDIRKAREEYNNQNAFFRKKWRR